MSNPLYKNILEPNTENDDNWNTNEINNLIYNDYYNSYKSIIKSELVDNLNINRIDVTHELNANVNPTPKNVSQFDYAKEKRLNKGKSKIESVSFNQNKEIVDDINILLNRLDNFPIKKMSNNEKTTNKSIYFILYFLIKII